MSRSGSASSGEAALISAMGTILRRMGAESALQAKKNRMSGSSPAAKSLSTPAFQLSSLVPELSSTVLPVRASYSRSSST